MNDFVQMPLRNPNHATFPVVDPEPSFSKVTGNFSDGDIATSLAIASAGIVFGWRTGGGKFFLFLTSLLFHFLSFISFFFLFYSSSSSFRFNSFSFPFLSILSFISFFFFLSIIFFFFSVCSSFFQPRSLLVPSFVDLWACLQESCFHIRTAQVREKILNFSSFFFYHQFSHSFSIQLV